MVYNSGVKVTRYALNHNAILVSQILHYLVNLAELILLVDSIAVERYRIDGTYC